MSASTPPSPTIIAFAGLDLLHATRLRAACLLLLSARPDVGLQPWGPHPARLLVAGDDDAGRTAIAQARGRGVPVLRVSDAPDAADGAGLRRGATVRELHDRLGRALLAAGERVTHVRRHLFACVADADADLLLLEHGLSRVLVARATGDVHVLRAADGLDALIRDACQAGWHATPVRTRAAADHAADTVASLRWEDLVWTAAIGCPQPLETPAAGAPVQLRAWPLVDRARLPDAWLLPVACLLDRPWPPERLAAATGLAPVDVARILAAVAYSGLRRDARAGTTDGGPAKGALPGIFQRIARRFGLAFSRGTT